MSLCSTHFAESRCSECSSCISTTTRLSRVADRASRIAALWSCSSKASSGRCSPSSSAPDLRCNFAEPACDDSFIRRYGRRLAALAVFGAVAEIFFGYWVLLGYAIWGIPLLLVRRWSNRAPDRLPWSFVRHRFQCRAVTRAVYLQSIGSPERFAAGQRAATEQDAAARKEFQATQRASDYRTAVSGRLRYMPHKYSQGPFILPTNDFTLFLIGLLALRLGLFDQPQRHRRVIVGVMIFGALSWATTHWLLPFTITSTPPSLAAPRRGDADSG